MTKQVFLIARPRRDAVQSSSSSHPQSWYLTPAGVRDAQPLQLVDGFLQGIRQCAHSNRGRQIACCNRGGATARL